MALLEDLVDGYQALECLDLVCKYWLPLYGFLAFAFLRSMGAGEPTLSYQPRKTAKICDPMCRQCKLEHVSLGHSAEVI